MSRADILTALDLALDCDLLGQPIHQAVIEIQQSAASVLRARSRIRVQSHEHAEHVLSRMRQLFWGEERRLLEQGSSLRTWKSLECHWPGRIWTSLRDDFEALAKKFWIQEKIFLYGVAEFIVQIR